MWKAIYGQKPGLRLYMVKNQSCGYIWPKPRATAIYGQKTGIWLFKDNLFKNIFDFTTAGDWDC